MLSQNLCVWLCTSVFLNSIILLSLDGGGQGEDELN